MVELNRILQGDTRTLPAQPAPVVAGVQEPEAESADLEPLGAFSADVSARMKPTYALMQINRAGEDYFAVTGSHHDNQLQLRTRTMSKPKLALGDLADRDSEERQQARNIRLLMREWSRHAESIRDWIEGLRAAVGDQDLHIVVWDDTGYEIPWELLYLWGDERAGRTRGWLGELLAMTRMVTIHAGDPTEQWDPIALGDHVSSGDTIAHLGEGMENDLASLTGFSPSVMTEAGLLTRLEDEAPVALVYVAAHGEFSASMTELTLGGLGLAEFDYGSLPALLGSHGVVFMNACHSARLINEERLIKDERRNHVLFGFAEMFLRKGAATVVGTVGKVETDRAHHVAHEVLSEIVDDPQVSVAEAVRRVRARAAAKVQTRRPHQEELKEFFYTFMYVCYGNPYTKIGVPGNGADDA
ncbi:hypothetical protein ALI22I_19935 [Saccharothrix sp. ALI-22-I]|uniref:CHAT domain-containing protein n=1 Tax=Saccharothrix sp. ALI-22-I TaxID=1933778 RepID=UPI00097BD37F|nr:CHAT domain-containing protein [Saccharothrix sp. ALI-22-I]ONI88018.1 hypothetical protein ALI22I_19935 [Saccharothrix sp. ALI-22-I]